jgi:hypothetical protein
MKYKLETYQKKFQILSMIVQQIHRYWAKMRKLKHGLVEQLTRRKYKLRNHKTSKVEQLRRRRCKQRNHRTLKVRKNHKEFRNNNRWRLFQQ